MGQMLLLGGRLSRGRPVIHQIYEAWSVAIARAYYEQNHVALRALVALYDGCLVDVVHARSS